MRTSPNARPQTADEVLARLIAGNDRFVRGEARFPTVQKEVLAALADEQRPYATILGCSDSRVPPELIFDAGFGELFIVRVAGNVVSPGVLGSLHYAAIHLETPLFMVLGHERCGAISAALTASHDAGAHSGPIARLLNKIRPALRDLPAGLSPEAELDAAVEANVRWSMQQIRDTPEAQARLADRTMKLVGARYDLDTGHVTFYE
jgi:carbonic anhydrase